MNHEPQTSNLHSERRWAQAVAACAVALTAIPHLFGYSLLGKRPEFGWYSWLPYNQEDANVYLAWMRQAAEGHFFQRDLFTTQPQSGLQFNLFFLLCGKAAGLLHLHVIFVFHAARMLLGIAFLRAVWWLLELFLVQPFARRCAFMALCFSSGAGWLLYALGVHTSSADLWQSEAITFLSLSFNPLFLAGLLLMACIMGLLWIAEERRSFKPALGAGACGLILGNIHTYDVVPIFGAWGCFLFTRTILQRKFEFDAWLRWLAACGMTAISTAYTYYLLKTDSTFAQRAAVETLSDPPHSYLFGYGFTLLLASAGAVLAWRASRYQAVVETSYPTNRRDAALLLIVWALVHFIAAYLPVAFQRKMLMGAHIPIAILAGFALSRVLMKIYPADEFGSMEKENAWKRRTILFMAVVFLSLSNWLVVRWVIRYLPQNRSLTSNWARPFLYSGEIDALHWLRENAPSGAVIQPLPWVRRIGQDQVSVVDISLASAAPGQTGHSVDAGHSGETPNFLIRIGQWAKFVLPETSDESRRELLEKTGVRYLIFSQKHNAINSESPLDDPAADFRGKLPPFLRGVSEASNTDAEVYEFTK